MTSKLSAARAFIEQVAGEPRVILDREGLRPYLSRHYLLGRPTMFDGSKPWDANGNPKREAMFPDGVGVYLHRFHQGDTGWMHNHPWEWALSLVLEHGYREERVDPITLHGQRGIPTAEGHGYTTNDWRPRDVNLITHDTFHRVTLLGEWRGQGDDDWAVLEPTTLFVTGPKTGTWGFWDEENGRCVPWREHLAAQRGG